MYSRSMTCVVLLLRQPSVSISPDFPKILLCPDLFASESNKLVFWAIRYHLLTDYQ